MQRQLGQLVINPWTRFQFALQGAGYVGVALGNLTAGQALTAVLFNQAVQTTNVLLWSTLFSAGAGAEVYLSGLDADPGYAARWTAYSIFEFPNPSNLNTELFIGGESGYGIIISDYMYQPGVGQEMLAGGPLLIPPGRGVQVAMTPVATSVRVNFYFYQTPL